MHTGAWFDVLDEVLDVIHAFILRELSEARALAPAAGQRRSMEALDALLQASVARHGGGALFSLAASAGSHPFRRGVPWAKTRCPPKLTTPPGSGCSIPHVG